MAAATKLVAMAAVGTLGAVGLISWANSQDSQNQASEDFGIYANYQSEVWDRSSTPSEPGPAQPTPSPSRTGLTPDQIRANVLAAREQARRQAEQQAHEQELKRIRKEARKETSTVETPAFTQDCTPGYEPCLPPADDYDCAGGSGNGPAYTGRVSVFGSDPYDLDADGDGVGCE